MGFQVGAYRLKIVDNGYYYEYLIQTRLSWMNWRTEETHYDKDFAEKRLKELNDAVHAKGEKE